MAAESGRLHLISIFDFIILYNSIFTVRCCCIILTHIYPIIIYPIVITIDFRLNITLHKQITIRAEAILFPSNGFPFTFRIYVAFLNIPPYVIIIIVLYPTLNIITADPAIAARSGESPTSILYTHNCPENPDYTWSQ